MIWRPATIEQVKAIVAEESALFDAEQSALFERFRVEPFIARLYRAGQWEGAVVVARKDDRVVYWEDVEEGFNESPIEDGRILQHWCNQDRLGVALNHWIQGRQGPPRFGKPEPLKFD